MDRIRALRNPIRHYDWGSREAIARWQGRPAPAAEPEAELWLGAHPSSPSQVILPERGGASEPLDRWIERDRAAALGGQIEQLPFLFKVLAPARALSIQTHPDAERARRGFERENAAGLALDDPCRSYRDPHAKPELICALTRFSALCGFRPRAEVSAGLAELALPELSAVRAAVDEAGSAAGLRSLLEQDDATRRHIALQVAELAERAEADATHGAALSLVARLGRERPGDAGILAPLWLNAVELAAGDALFLAAGQIHAYLEGFGVELMGNSDNTLRGGLTDRHIDVPELVAALDTSEARPTVLRPTRDGGRTHRYVAPTPAFELRSVEVTRSAPFVCSRCPGPEIWLCTQGHARIADERHGGHIDLPQGSAVWVPAAAGAYRVDGIDGVDGTATLHVAGIPH